MKTRTGFVSNSSTTCFILMTSLSDAELEILLKQLCSQGCAEWQKELWGSNMAYQIMQDHGNIRAHAKAVCPIPEGWRAWGFEIDRDDWDAVESVPICKTNVLQIIQCAEGDLGTDWFSTEE